MSVARGVHPFNARHWRLDEIANAFVPPEHFGRVLARRPTILVGPRGSGKTTLLKMLQRRALAAWRGDEAEEARAIVDYTAVFIPADLTWRSQVQAAGRALTSPDAADVLARATFATHVLRRMAEAMADRLIESGNLAGFRQVALSRTDESRLAARVARLWHIAPDVPSLLGVKQALLERQVHLREWATALVGASQSEIEAAVRRQPFLHIDHFEATAGAASLFNDAVGESEGRWVLCFDELELAPSRIVRHLVESMRSREDTLILKLAMSPVTADLPFGESAQGSMIAQDFDLVKLWYENWRESLPFCRKLWSRMRALRGLPSADPETVLGHSYFVTDPDDWREDGTAYREDTVRASSIDALAKRDKTFERYLRDHDVAIDGLSSLDGIARAKTVRKIFSVVAIREFYRRDDGSGRSRKRAALFFGLEAVFGATEGNPRQFLNIVGRLFDRSGDSDRQIDPATQAAELEQAAERFNALLRSVPLPQSDAVTQRRGLLAVTNTIGAWLHDQLVGGEFKPEPAGSFTVDSRLPTPFFEVVATGVNVGAFYLIGQSDDQVASDSVRGRRYRLSYLLAANFGLPLRKGRTVALSSILMPAKSGQIEFTDALEPQGD